MRKSVPQLRDRVVVITGASSGLGRELAVQSANAGAQLVLAARREEDLERTAELCRERGAPVLVVPTDEAAQGRPGVVDG